jgi:SAM-dependent methyltransferase
MKPAPEETRPLEDLLARFERERLEADRLYNDALTALDRSLPPLASSAVPGPPAVDTTHLASLDAASKIAASRSSLNGLKGWLGRWISRAIRPQLEQQNQFNAAVVDHARRSIAAADALRQAHVSLTDAVRNESDAMRRFESQLIQYLQTITVYVDTKDRSIGGRELRDRLTFLEQRVAALKREIESRAMPSTVASASASASTSWSVAPPSSSPAAPSLTAAVSGARDDADAYVGFEDRFRGSQSEIRRRVEDYVPLLAGASDVVDVGCGRGELLDLLKARGVRARGVDANEAMVDLCRARGLDVVREDALAYLQRQPDAEKGGIGGLIAVQVVEHFEPAYLARFLDTAYRKMRPGAPLILETLNPACWMAFFECYIRDLTHQRPLHPETLRYLVEASGFTSVDVQYRQPVTDDDRLDRVALPAMSTAGGDSARLAELATALNAHADKLNRRLFSSMDYAVVARR